VSIRVMTLVWDGYQGGGSELLALLALADWSDDEGRCFPSVAAIGRKTRLSEKQARRVVHSLIDDGVVKVVAGKDGGRGSRRYQISLDRLRAETAYAPLPPKGGLPRKGGLPPMGGHPSRGWEATPPTDGSRTVIDTPEIRQEAGDCPPAADSGKKPSAMKGSRLAADWQLPRAWGEWALSEVPGWSADHVRKVGEMFGDYWRSKAGKDAAKADWMATWRNWVRREAGRNGPAISRGSPTSASDPFRGCL